jgi:RNA polymerase sigma factor (sigma-70 family)
MTHRLIANLMKQTGRLSLTAATDRDEALLTRFVSARDEAAFAELARRHGPMVWGVCRNALASETDAEDAFQATFLTLVRRARAIRRAASLGPWLHGTAVRICLRLRRTNGRRRSHEARAAKSSLARAPDTWSDELARVHEGIGRLPRREHEVFVYCVLQGASREEASERLGIKVSSVTGLLARARRRLRSSLGGPASFPVLALTVAVGSPSGVPASLLAKASRMVAPAARVPDSIYLLTTSLTEVTMRRKTLLIATLALALGGLTAGKFLASAAEAQSSRPTGRTDNISSQTASGWQGRQDAAQDHQDRLHRLGYAKGPSKAGATPPWEYKVLFRDANSSVENVLNELGAAGWELASTSPATDSTRVMFVFKRPKHAGVSIDFKPTPVRDAPSISFNEQDGRAKPGELTVKPSVNFQPEFQVIPLKHVDAATTAELLKGLLKSCQVETNATTNSLLVRGPEEDVAMLKKVIQRMDSRESQDKGPRKP